MIYFTSDTHFGHANIIRYCDRPFKDARDMDRQMIARWNEVVEPRDTVFHLGDFAFGPKPYAMGMLHRLRGRKVLIRGNHDGSEARCRDLGFDDVHDSMYFQNLRGERIFMSHKPLDAYTGLDEVAQLCGHVHTEWARKTLYYYDAGNRKVSVKQVNVGVDRWDFRPRTLEELLACE